MLTNFKTERNMVQVCEGAKTKGGMLEEAITQYKDIFMRAKNGFNNVLTVSLAHSKTTQPNDNFSERSKPVGTRSG